MHQVVERRRRVAGDRRTGARLIARRGRNPTDGLRSVAPPAPVPREAARREIPHEPAAGTPGAWAARAIRNAVPVVGSAGVRIARRCPLARRTRAHRAGGSAARSRPRPVAGARHRRGGGSPAGPALRPRGGWGPHPATVIVLTGALFLLQAVAQGGASSTAIV